MPAAAGHLRGVALETEALDLGDAGGAIGAEEEADELGDEVVESAAFLGVGEVAAVGAGGVFALDAAGADLAPGSFDVGMAAGTAALEVGAAGSAVESAVRYEAWVGGDGWHGRLLLKMH